MKEDSYASSRSKRQPGAVELVSFPPRVNPAKPKMLDSEKAYEAIKHWILTCAFKPGEVLNETYLSQLVGLGRNPVARAIDRLRRDGLLEVIPRKGIFVKPVSLDEVMQIIEVRLLNETHCVRLAAERAESSDIEYLTSILAEARKHSASEHREQMMLLDRAFHLGIARAADNDVLAELLSKLNERLLRFWFVSLGDPIRTENVHVEHDDILTAIREHDPDAAEAAMREHVDSFRRSLTGNRRASVLSTEEENRGSGSMA